MYVVFFSLFFCYFLGCSPCFIILSTADLTVNRVNLFFPTCCILCWINCWWIRIHDKKPRATRIFISVLERKVAFRWNMKPHQDFQSEKCMLGRADMDTLTELRSGRDTSFESLVCFLFVFHMTGVVSINYPSPLSPSRSFSVASLFLLRLVFSLPIDSSSFFRRGSWPCIIANRLEVSLCSFFPVFFEIFFLIRNGNHHFAHPYTSNLLRFERCFSPFVFQSFLPILPNFG